MTKHQRGVLKKLLAKACRLRDGEKCLKCGSVKTLQTSHIYPKGTYKKMEFNINNVKTLCYRCHIHWWHKNIVEAKEWLDRTINKERLMNLKADSLKTDKTPFNKEYYNKMKLYLEYKIREYEAQNYNKNRNEQRFGDW